MELSRKLVCLSLQSCFVSFIFFIQGENLIVAVDDDGLFTGKITDFSSCYVKDADKDIIEAVKVKTRPNLFVLFVSMRLLFR